jgi:hypothetical protein
MPSRHSLKLLSALAVVISCAAPAAAQEGPTTLQRMLGNLGLLAIPSDETIDYRERAPLVVPPTTDLPVPRSPADISLAVPDWPTDPEIVRERERKRLAKQPNDFQYSDPFYSGRVLRGDELRKGTTKQRDRVATQTTEPMLGLDRLSPAALSFKGWFEKEKPIVFSGEPARERLTDPPPGYQVPSPNAPYGVVEKDKPGTKPKTPFDNIFGPYEPGK